VRWAAAKGIGRITSRLDLTMADDVVNAIFQIMNFDKGNFSSGANVRDAACYVAWAFARAFDPLILQDYQVDLAKTLLKVTLFDREINCRRAASAAF